MNKKKTEYSSKATFWTSMFYTFLTLTVLAAIFHLFGLAWFEQTVTIQEPAVILQKFIKALLKVFELVFVYQILVRQGYVISSFISILQVLIIGFIPVNYQCFVDLAVMLLVVLIFRDNKWQGLIDFVALFILMNGYSSLVQLAKFGSIHIEYTYSFYAGIISLIAYKLFIVTLYMFIQYRGGIRLWKIKRKLFQIATDQKI